MGNVGSLALDLVTAEGGPANETNCTVECFRLDGVSILRKDHLQFPPRRAFPLPAFPQMQNLHMMITPSLYKMVQSEFFTLDDGESKLETLPVQRDPAEWQPKFTLWNALANKFDALKSAIDGQRTRLIDGTDIGVMSQVLYDAMGSTLLLPKMAMLNLFTVLTTQKDPVSTQPWFNMVKQILVIDQERFVAVVDSNLFESVDHILNNMDQFKRQGFFAGDTSLHEQNIPKELTLTADMISVKKVYAEGNVQWTMGRVQDSGGTKSVLLDCDMDEHHNVIEHLSDLFKHLFTGGTHPIDIHEYIVSVQQGADLGYGLLPKAAAAAGIAA